MPTPVILMTPPVAAQARAWSSLGFEQCVPAYLREIGVPAEEIEIHRAGLALHAQAA
jgi:hypothetical protein